jgi:hypothetical protein
MLRSRESGTRPSLHTAQIPRETFASFNPEIQETLRLALQSAPEQGE